MSQTPANRKKRLNITLTHLYPIAQYLGAAWVALNLPQLAPNTWIFGEVTVPRQVMMLWVVLILLIDLALDRASLKAMVKDVHELKAGIKGGGLNRSTLLALTVPLMFILDFAVIAHLYVSFGKSGASGISQNELTLHTAALATGMILWIYGRFMPALKFGSIWGIRTKKNLASQQVWGTAHLKAAPMVTLVGAVILVLATFLSPVFSVAFAAFGIILAFGIMMKV